MTHHIHSVIVSYKRMGLTKLALQGYLETVSIPYSLVIVDNGSPPDVVDWLRTIDETLSNVDVLLLGENRYPGYATNRGWELMPPETTLLQRIDNDTLLLPGWCDEMVEIFDADPMVGQYGPTCAGDVEFLGQYPGWPVGGNGIIRRSLYDQGIKYDERPWEDGWDETPILTTAVLDAGYKRAFGLRQPGIEYMGDGDVEYHRESRGARGLTL